jgi:hypothetical protein
VLRVIENEFLSKRPVTLLQPLPHMHKHSIRSQNIQLLAIINFLFLTPEVLKHNRRPNVGCDSEISRCSGLFEFSHHKFQTICFLQLEFRTEIIIYLQYFKDCVSSSKCQ